MRVTDHMVLFAFRSKARIICSDGYAGITEANNDGKCECECEFLSDSLSVRARIVVADEDWTVFLQEWIRKPFWRRRRRFSDDFDIGQLCEQQARHAGFAQAQIDFQRNALGYMLNQLANQQDRT